MSYIGNSPLTTAFLTDTFSGNGSTTAFTMTVAPATTSSILVSITGVVQSPDTYSVSGTTLTFSAAPPTGTSNISVRFLGIPASGVTTTAYRTVTDSTATAGQTTFTIPSYTVGYINVFRNGSLLAGSDYTATSGTSVVLANAASAGDTITTESFYVSSVLNALPTTGGSISGQLTVNSATGQKPLIAQVNGTEVFEVDASGNVGVGTSSPSTKLDVVVSGTGDQNILGLRTTGGGGQGLWLGVNTTNSVTTIKNNTGSYGMAFYSGTGTSESMRIDSSGNLLIGRTAVSGFTTSSGLNLVPTDGIAIGKSTSVNWGSCLYMNRMAAVGDGNLVEFATSGTVQGTISVSGTTVSYNGGHLSRWAQTESAKDDSLVKGTVLSNLDAMNVYTDSEGNPVANEQLNKVKVSDVEGDSNVAGVFVNWAHDDAHDVDEINMAMTGDMIIRIAQGVTVQRGDLLMSAGDGTAKSQGDDIIRSKTVAKVTSTHVTCTYADGSYCVPCVLMAC